MVEHRSQRLSWWLGGVAALGVLLTHWLTYRVVLPDAHHRAQVLHDTGHAHVPIVSAIGLALFTAAAFRACAALPGLRWTVLRLALVQGAAWTVLEVGERAASGRLATIDDHALLLVGLGVQVVIALVGAALLRVARRVLSFARRKRPAAPRPQSVRLPTRPWRPHPLLPLTGGHALRAPPLLLRPSS